MELLGSILFATVVAGTPLIIVALGQLVAEKSGVLNLGAEGMMAMGAIAEAQSPRGGAGASDDADEADGFDGVGGLFEGVGG